MDPAHVFQHAGVIEVEDQARCQHGGGTGTDLHGTPGADARCLQAAFDAFSVGGQVDLEGPVVVFQDQIRRGIVEYACLVQVQVESAVGFQLQGGLDSPVRDFGLGGVIGPGYCIEAGNL